MKKLIIAVLVLVLLLGAGLVILKGRAGEGQQSSMQGTEETTAPSEEPSTQPTETTAPPEETLNLAPDFVVYNKDGEPVSLSDFRGKPVVVNFWASWCGPCKREMPEFESLWQELGDQVHFLMVNVTTSESGKEAPEALLAELGYGFPVYYDLTGSASDTYGVTAFPTTYFIGAQGEAVAYAVGAIDGDTIRRGIQMTQGQE